MLTGEEQVQEGGSFEAPTAHSGGGGQPAEGVSVTDRELAQMLDMPGESTNSCMESGTS